MTPHLPKLNIERLGLIITGVTFAALAVLFAILAASQMVPALYLVIYAAVSVLLADAVFVLTKRRAKKARFALGTVLAAVSIPRTFVVCFVPRLLAGLLCGLVFQVCRKHDRRGGWSFVAAGVCGSLLNTALFLGALALLFWNVQFTPDQAAALGGVDTVLKTVIGIAAGLNAPIELVVCAVLGSAVGKGLTVALKRR